MESLPDPDWYVANVVIPGGPPDEREMTPLERWQAQWSRRAEELAAADSEAHRRVAELACAQGFVLTTAQALGAGVDRPELRRLVRSGRWSFVRRSVVTPLVVGDRESRAVLQAAAAVLARPATAASHESAAVVHGLPLVHRRKTPTVTATTSTLSGHRGELHARRAAVAGEELVTWFGMALTDPARTVLDLARHDRAAGLVAADFALRQRLCTPGRLELQLAGSVGWPGNRSATWVVQHADPLAESPLESLTRHALAAGDLPAPTLQAWIRDPGGRWSYRADMLWDTQRVVLEADGRAKYGRTGALRDGGTDALWQEKLRQNRLETLGYRVVRTVWAEVTAHPEALADRVRRLLAA